MHGHPIVFRLTDFVREESGEFSNYKMQFPKELKSVLDRCELIVWGWEEQRDLLDAAYECDPEWFYFPTTGAARTLRRSRAQDWNVLDIALLNRLSSFGELRVDTAAEFYNTDRNRSLVKVLDVLSNDPGSISKFENRVWGRVGGLEQNRGMAVGFIAPGMLHNETNHPEDASIT
ncbi:MAG: hypothetical protein GY820_21740, partial [Gammaproteobacteria bacterium]|nr:hypothetical protein [Gammaproteobacteria bacterium]